MRFIIIFFAIVALIASAAAEKASFKNYKVFRIIPVTENQLELLRTLEDRSEGGYSFWRGPSKIGQPVDVMVEPSLLSEFASLMNTTASLGGEVVGYETYVPDVQELIEQENPPTREAGFGWSRYHRLEEIYSWLDSLGEQYSDKAEPLIVGKSYEGRDIKGVKLSFGQDDRPAIFVEGGIHAREWISPATVTYIANELLTSSDPEIRALAEAHDWYLVPSFNPDGYVYTHTKNRLWRKTLSRSSMFCRGADANRNWGYKWMSGGSSNNPCADTYAGRSAFSEVETRTLSQFIKSIGDKLFAYVAFHSYSQLLLFPYGHTKEHLDNHDEAYAIGMKTTEALAKRYGTQYTTGNIAETIYVASGSSMDWVKATLKVPVAFTYELRDTGKYGFILPAEQIIPNGQEILDSLIAMFKEAANYGYPKPRQ